MLDWHDDADIHRVELQIDECALAHHRPDPQISLKERRQRLERCPAIVAANRMPIHRHMIAWPCKRPDFARREVMVMKIGKRDGMRV